MSQVSSTKPDAAQMQAQELNELLKMATLGHLPLFHQDWIRESFRENKRLSFARASRIVDESLRKLSRHVTYDRKQTALNAFTAEERVTFIQSFFKMVEYKTLDQIKELH